MTAAGVRTAVVVLRRVAMLAVLVAICFRPGFGETTAPTRLSDLEVLVVVDRTRSMAALDHDGGPRIEGVREDLTTLAAALPGSRFSVLTFGKVVREELPFTSDTTAFDTLVATVSVEGILDGTGSLVDRPLEQMEVILERAAEQHPDRRRVVLLVTDGENTAEGEQASYAGLADLVDGGAVLGYGSTEGGTMPVDDELSADGGLIYDRDTGEDAISRIDEDNLRLVADELGVDYLHRDGVGVGGMDDLAESLEGSLEGPRVDDGGEAPAQHQLTWVLALALLALALVELRSSWRGLLGARREARR